MKLNELHVRRFRNIERIELAPADGVNLFVGENAQGKTNLLEAIHMVLLGRSFRTRREEQCLPWSRGKGSGKSTPPSAQGGEASSPPPEDRAESESSDAVEPPTAIRLDAECTTASGTRTIRLVLDRSGKSVQLDGKLIPRLADLWTGAGVVLFSPDDVDLFRDAPARRRQFLDQLLSQASPVYLGEVQRYQQAVRQVNKLLKSGDAPSRTRSLADAYYPGIAASGAEILRHRRRMIAELSDVGGELFTQLGGQGRFKLSYSMSFAADSSVDETRDAFLEHLRRSHDENARWGQLRSGPHRDDLKASLDGRDLGSYGSQGQHRLTALALKLGAAERLRRDLNDPPILLLDDFGSELDPFRRRAVLDNLRGRMQTFVTATELKDLGSVGDFDLVRTIHGGAFVAD